MITVLTTIRWKPIRDSAGIRSSILAKTPGSPRCASWRSPTQSMLIETCSSPASRNFWAFSTESSHPLVSSAV